MPNPKDKALDAEWFKLIDDNKVKMVEVRLHPRDLYEILNSFTNAGDAASSGWDWDGSTSGAMTYRYLPVVKDHTHEGAPTIATRNA